MAYTPLYGFTATLAAATPANVGVIQLSLTAAAALAARLGANYTYASISDGVNYEIVRIVSVSGANVNVQRAVSGTTSSAFPSGSCLQFVLNIEGIDAVLGAASINIVGAGVTTATYNPGTHTWTITTPMTNVTGTAPIQVLGDFPSYTVTIDQISNCCCG